MSISLPFCFSQTQNRGGGGKSEPHVMMEVNVAVEVDVVSAVVMVTRCPSEI